MRKRTLTTTLTLAVLSIRGGEDKVWLLYEVHATAYMARKVAHAAASE